MPYSLVHVLILHIDVYDSLSFYNYKQIFLDPGSALSDCWTATTIHNLQKFVLDSLRIICLYYLSSLLFSILK